VVKGKREGKVSPTNIKPNFARAIVTGQIIAKTRKQTIVIRPTLLTLTLTLL